MAWQDFLSNITRRLFGRDEGREDPPAAAAVQDCENFPLIVAFGFTDQPNDKALFGGTRKQYVNLRNAQVRTADAEILSDNQLGQRPPIFLRVSPPQATPVQVRLMRIMYPAGFPAGSENLSAREQGLAHLQWDGIESNHSTNTSGELWLRTGKHISALGGGEYRVQAALPGQNFVTASNAVLVKRRIYMQPVQRHANGMNAATTAIAAVRDQLEPLGIELQVLAAQAGPELGVQERTTLPHQAIIDIGRDALAPPGVTRNLRPHSVAVIVGEFVTAAITPRQFTVDVLRDPGTGQFPSPVQVALVDSGNQFVLVPLTDGSQIVSATLQGGGRSRPIAAAAVAGRNAFSTQLSVDISAVRGDFAGSAAVRLVLRLKAINSWAVGWAYTDHPVIYLNMRDPNTDTILTAARAEALVIHELGHKLHLAASGEGGQPDQQAHHYPSFNTNGVQHQGPHCSVGVPAGTDLWTQAAQTAATCTMWGRLKGITAYCDECKTSLRKVDLSGGF